jgi:hypothetical protein
LRCAQLDQTAEADRRETRGKAQGELCVKTPGRPETAPKRAPKHAPTTIERTFQTNFNPTTAPNPKKSASTMRTSTSS